MGIIQNFLKAKKEKAKQQDEICKSLTLQIEQALQEKDDFFKDSSVFVDPIKGYEWNNHNSSLMESVSLTHIAKMKRAKSYKELLGKQVQLYDNTESIRTQISDHNEKVANSKVQDTFSKSGICFCNRTKGKI